MGREWVNMPDENRLWAVYIPDQIRTRSFNLARIAMGRSLAVEIMQCV